MGCEKQYYELLLIGSVELLCHVLLFIGYGKAMPQKEAAPFTGCKNEKKCELELQLTQDGPAASWTGYSREHGGGGIGGAGRDQVWG